MNKALTKLGDVRCVRLACQPTSQQYCSLILNQHQPPATSQSAVLFSHNKSAQAISYNQTNTANISSTMPKKRESYVDMNATTHMALHIARWHACGGRPIQNTDNPLARGTPRSHTHRDSLAQTQLRAQDPNGRSHGVRCHRHHG